MVNKRRSDAKGSVVFLDPCALVPVKRCSKCSQVRPMGWYRRVTKRRDGLHPQCQECERAQRQSYYQRNREGELERTGRWAREHPEVGREGSRRWREANRDLLRDRKRQEYAENGEAIRELLRDAGFRRKYGISLAEREELAERQGLRCSVCGTHESQLDKRLAVDHDHATGAVRALLCQTCNLGLGFFKDSPELLEKAAEYVRHHTNRMLSEAVEFDGA